LIVCTHCKEYNYITNKDYIYTQWRSRRNAAGSRCSEGEADGAGALTQSELIKEHIYSRNLNQSMPKMRYYLSQKIAKITLCTQTPAFLF